MAHFVVPNDIFTTSDYKKYGYHFLFSRPESVDVEVKLKPRLLQPKKGKPEDNFPSPLNVENFEEKIEKKFEELFEEKFEDKFDFDPIIEVVP